jgi:hypothetical protein
MRLTDVIVGFGLIGAGLYRMGRVPTLLMQFSTFAVMIPAGMITVYSIWLMLTHARVLVRTAFENFGEVFYAFYETGRFPVTIYNRWLRPRVDLRRADRVPDNISRSNAIGKALAVLRPRLHRDCGSPFLRFLAFLELRDPLLLERQQLIRGLARDNWHLSEERVRKDSNVLRVIPVRCSPTSGLANLRDAACRIRFDRRYGRAMGDGRSSL